MATNGDSARKWLAENKHLVTEARILQIRNKLENKLNELPEPSDANQLIEEHQGLLEAIDVMETFLQEQLPATATAIEPHSIYASSLVSEPVEPIIKLDDTEKKLRFQQLLKTSKVLFCPIKLKS